MVPETETGSDPFSIPISHLLSQEAGVREKRGKKGRWKKGRNREEEEEDRQEKGGK